MESRLPKPKIYVKKATSTMDIAVEKDIHQVTVNSNGLSSSASTSNTGTASEGLKKAKSTLNLDAKVANENHPPPTRTFLRAKTLSTITRSNVTMRPAVKRPGTATTAVETKRANVRPAPRSNFTQRPTAATSARTTTTKTPVNSTTARQGQTKPKKWDITGNLNYTKEQLSTLQEKHKIIAARNSDLEKQIQNLSAEESEMRKKVDKLEVTNENLKKEVDLLTSEVHELRSKNTELNERTESQKRTIEELNTMKDNLRLLTHSLDRDRRALRNTIQEMKGNIRVFCRVRPRIPKESAKGVCTINYPDECTIEVGKSENSEVSAGGVRARGARQEFSFDKVFPPNSSQADIFEELSLLVQSALEGYNVCVFAYGQTGSGKTYTMEGDSRGDSEGMIPRTVRHIFDEMKNFELLGWRYQVEASFLEIYNEHIVDLLDFQQKTHDIRMVDSKGSDVYVTNLHTEVIKTPQELEECLKTAQKNRAVAATRSNERSSRSHSVAQIRLIGIHTLKDEKCVGNLNLVDLAGSERLKGDGTDRTEETKNINKSLANLGNVILALLKKQDHVPYRNSKLTHLLMPSLGGNSKTLMLLNISPLDECYNETLNSLRFASNVNNCRTGNIKRTRTVLQNSM